MLDNLRLNRILWCITAVLAMAAALAGIAVRGLYVGLFPPDYLPGAFPQDVLTVLVCAALLLLAATMKDGQTRKQIAALGVIGSLFYLYGIFTIERVYNGFYLLYAAVFAMSFWSLAYGLASLRRQALLRMSLPGGLRITTAVVSLLIAAIFTVLWVASLIPIMRERNRIEFLYSIYILDLCFVMPAFAITAVMALRRQALGFVLGPAIMILGFFVIFPLGLNELARPAAGLTMNVGPMVISFLFSAAMLALAAFQIRALHVE